MAICRSVLSQAGVPGNISAIRTTYGNYDLTYLLGFMGAALHAGHEPCSVLAFKTNGPPLSM
eukprot:scaffold167607_cov35-Prasinocladus_malaysianus.AAC.1